MALGLGRIPGHSGTANKNRKAFFALKAHKKRWENAVDEDAPSTAHSYSQIRRDRILKKQTQTRRALLLIIPILVLGNLLVWKFEMFFPDFIKEQYAQHREFAKQERALRIARDNDNGYQVLTRSGEMFLSVGEFDYAQTELARAIRIYPYSKRANIAMTKLLLKRCTECKRYCAEAEEYLEFLNSLHEVTVEDIRKVEDYAFAN